jgi:ribose 5-phosphate isomerase A
MTADDQKAIAARAAADLVQSGMRVGLGTGSTVAHLLPALAVRHLDIVCVATSPATSDAAIALGLRVINFEEIDELDIAIDGADQIDPIGWLIKGAGGAQTREKIVAAAAARFVVIGDASKRVTTLASPVPLELIAFGLDATLARLGHVTVRNAALSPDGGIIADYTGPIDDPTALSARLAGTPGVVEHGLFPPTLVSDVITGTDVGVVHLTMKEA